MTDQPQDEWGPWIEHDGQGCPVVGQYVQVVAEWKDHITGSDGLVVRPGPDWYWRNFPKTWMVRRYRIRKPRGMAILESILADTPEQVNA